MFIRQEGKKTKTFNQYVICCTYTISYYVISLPCVCLY